VAVLSFFTPAVVAIYCKHHEEYVRQILFTGSTLSEC
jgi:hypothetical protein